MGRVKGFQIAGLDLQFRPHDHIPPHCHAIKPGVWEVMVDLRATTDSQLVLCGVAGWSRQRRPSGLEQRQLRELVGQHREALLAQWETEVKTDAQRRDDRQP